MAAFAGSADAGTATASFAVTATVVNGSGSDRSLQVPLTVYGRIPASQVVTAGAYTDTIKCDRVVLV